MSDKPKSSWYQRRMGEVFIFLVAAFVLFGIVGSFRFFDRLLDRIEVAAFFALVFTIVFHLSVRYRWRG